jgi:hypothetical protein
MFMKFSMVQSNLIALSVSLLFGATALAQTMTAGDFKIAKTKIKTEFSSEKTACASQAGNAKEICIAQAKGKEVTALAELDNSYKPTNKTHYKVQVAKAESTYDIAKQQCDDLSGNPKNVCIKEAKAAKVTAKADASVQLKSAAVTAKAKEKADSAQSAASSQKAEIRSDASADKRAAQFKVEKEKCDALAGTAKDKCLTDANARFGKP